MSVHRGRSLEAFSNKIHACLEAYDDAGGDPEEKGLFKDQVRHALLTEEYNVPSLDSDEAVPLDAWRPILRELDAMYAALRQSGPRPSGSVAYRPEEILVST